MHWRNIIRRPVVTEKSNYLADINNQYTFVVDSRANKLQIKQAV
ncbi:MAG: 50S ribosomal protein L23, partial [Anaerolineaceae bacterium]